MYKRVRCKDGFSFSVQAGDMSYCTPRDNEGPYSQVECGYPSEHEELLTRYAEDKEKPTDTVYGWVPVNIVTLVIAKHGGIVSGEVPTGVIPLMATYNTNDNTTTTTTPEVHFMAINTAYTITAYNRVTQTFTTLGNIIAESPQEAKQKFIDKVNWQETEENISLIVQTPICH